jgi:hypothetical protein
LTIAEAELYDPAAQTFIVTGSLITSRQEQFAALLGNGRVLVVGGVKNIFAGGQFTQTVLDSVELYDPKRGTFSMNGRLGSPRVGFLGVVLKNGKVLVASGLTTANGTDPLDNAELYDQHSGTSNPTGNLVQARLNGTATLLRDGKVLIAGGTSSGVIEPGTVLNSAELYDPDTGMFTPTGSMTAARQFHTATLLNNGLVLIAAGDDFPQGRLNSAELYNPTSSTFTATGSLTTARQGATATLLTNGDVLIAGGIGQDGSGLASAELFHTTTGVFTPVENMSIDREDHTATLLNGPR